MAQPGFAQSLKYKPIMLTTPDGLTISAQVPARRVRGRHGLWSAAVIGHQGNEW
jgi:hypothetical protein